MHPLYFSVCAVAITLAIYVILDQWQQRGVIDVPESYRFLVNDLFPKRKHATKRTGEAICRETLERIYGRPFPAQRPHWLRNPTTGRCLELDCYCEELRLAIEYDGEQHFVFPNTFHRTEEEFRQQLERDRIKKETCRRHGVRLINVPYTIPLRDLPAYVDQRLREIGML